MGGIWNVATSGILIVIITLRSLSQAMAKIKNQYCRTPLWYNDILYQRDAFISLFSA